MSKSVWGSAKLFHCNSTRLLAQPEKAHSFRLQPCVFIIRQVNPLDRPWSIQFTMSIAGELFCPEVELIFTQRLNVIVFCCSWPDWNSVSSCRSVRIARTKVGPYFDDNLARNVHYS